MPEDLVSHRELEAMLKPLNEGQVRIEKKLDDLGSLTTRVSVLESGRINWTMVVAFTTVVLGWLLTRLKWS